jgi:hypothetical protein
MGHANRRTNRVGRRLSTIGQEDPCSLIRHAHSVRDRAIASSSIKSVASSEISITRRGAAIVPVVMPVLPSGYNIWGHLGNRAQLVGSTNRCTSELTVIFQIKR